MGEIANESVEKPESRVMEDGLDAYDRQVLK